ncbi:MAG: DUF4124 domain-containing protein [Burkholderiales bacterium]
MRPILWFLITLPALPAAAGETCKYVDHEGRVTFANVPVKNARRVMCFDPVPAPKLAPRQVAPTAKPETAAPGGVAKVDSETQRRRDTDRKRILEQELGDEQRLLDQALRAIQDRGGSGSKEGGLGEMAERVRPALDAVARHERNIEAIRRELSGAR